MLVFFLTLWELNPHQFAASGFQEVADLAADLSRCLFFRHLLMLPEEGTPVPPKNKPLLRHLKSKTGYPKSSDAVGVGPYLHLQE